MDYVTLRGMFSVLENGRNTVDLSPLISGDYLLRKHVFWRLFFFKQTFNFRVTVSWCAAKLPDV